MHLHTLGRCAIGLVARNGKSLTAARAISCRGSRTIIRSNAAAIRSNAADSGPNRELDPVSASGTFTIPCAPPLKPVLRLRIRGVRIDRLRNQIHTFSLLGVCGLALAVFLWSFSYKLSLYQRHPAPVVRTSVAKLWIEPAKSSLVAVQRLRTQSHLAAGPQIICASIRWLPRLRPAATCIYSVQAASLQSFHLPTSLRSPPPQDFHTA